MSLVFGCKSFMNKVYEFFNSELNKQEGQLFLWSPVFISLGILLYFSLAFEPPLYIGFVALCFCILLARITWANPIWITSFILVLISLGFLCSQYRTYLVHTPILAKSLDYAEVRGRIINIEHIENTAERITLDNVHIKKLAKSETPKRVRIKFRSHQNFNIGDEIEFKGGLKEPSGPLIYDGFSFRKHLYFRSFGATGYAFGNATRLNENISSQAPLLSETLRHSIQNSLAQYIEKQHISAIAQALMVGKRGGISVHDYEAMRGAGLAHMLAISGLHIGLFSGITFFIVRFFLACFSRISLKYNVKKIAAAFAIIAGIFYMFIAGASIPTQRAVLMSTIFFLAIIFDRFPFSMRLVCFAAFIILIIFPETLMSASFQLSFSAVAGLVIFYDFLFKRFGPILSHSSHVIRVVFYVLSILMTSVIAGLATAPFALYHFQELPTYGLIGNLLAMPILSFIVMPFAFISYALMPFNLEQFSLPVVGWGIEIIIKTAHWITGFKHSIIHVSKWPPIVLTLLSLAFICLILLRGKIAILFSFSLFLISLFHIVNIKKPDLLINENMELIAVMNNESLYVNQYRRERFTRNIWAEALNENDVKKWPAEGEKGDITCGEQGCRISLKGKIIDYIYSAEDIDNSCIDADIILIKWSPYRYSCDAEIINYRRLRDLGGVAIFIDPKVNNISLRPFQEQNIKERPWVSGKLNDMF